MNATHEAVRTTQSGRLSGAGAEALWSRSYNPTQGRFASMDPYPGNMGDPSQFMRYGYAGGNPVANADPSGMMLAGVALGRATMGHIGVLGASAVLPAVLAAGAIRARTSQSSKIALGQLHYYEHLGWVDVTHVQNHPFAKSILTTVRSDSGTPVGGYRLYTFTHPGSEGGAGFFTGTITKNFKVKAGLSDGEKVEVAYAIYKRMEEGFEIGQGTSGVFPLTNSSFSVDDLPSDRIGFYIALNDLRSYAVGAMGKMRHAKSPSIGLSKATQCPNCVTPRPERLPGFCGQVRTLAGWQARRERGQRPDQRHGWHVRPSR